MIKKLSFNLFLLLLAQNICFSAAAKTETKNAKKTQEVYQLTYLEREPGTDEYEVTMLISDRFIRIDEVGEKSGYIIYDNKKRIIYSVAHQDKSVLVINQHVFSEQDSPVKTKIEYLQLADAPVVSGKNIYNYRVFVEKGKSVANEEETCMEFQLVEALLPEVRKILQNYQKVVSGQQVKMVDNKITEMQTSCFYADQIYNTGAYYEKGLPIQEWHSNERFKMLTTYNKISVDSDKFKIPESYRQFSIGEDPTFVMPE
ncbi:hypothetical protein MNBD_GAMMA06-1557 [hydrothermal vent metagenome]|uniref:Uncharacterized protein n=1 Tax=hydrothermal vent metagenome TaxID=652676 RepID=A0A3B0XB27_9ZZZZ